MGQASGKGKEQGDHDRGNGQPDPKLNQQNADMLARLLGRAQHIIIEIIGTKQHGSHAGQAVK